jgi:teichuronic acid biosynthesis glycosyltransferase TuaH
LTNAPRPVSVLVQGTADWNQPIATNQHYMVREISAAYPVLFVESLGLRRPELSRADLGRIVKRLRNRPAAGNRREVPAGVTVASPKVAPIHTGAVSKVNRKLLERTVKDWRASPDVKVYWTYSPITYGFEHEADVAVYHCVDLYGEYPGIDAKMVDVAEKELAATGITAVGSSEVVVAHLRAQGFRTVHYWPNVADTAELMRATANEPGTTRTGVIFSGNLSEKKIDFDLLRALLKRNVDLHLAGPVGEGGGSSQALVEELVTQGATYHGTLTFGELSKEMVRRKVGLIPYQLNAYTLGVSPLKTYEYLAAGLSVVSTNLPGVAALDPHVAVTTTAKEFVDATVAQLADPTNARAERSDIAEQHSWTGRGREARELLSSLIEAL